MDHDAGASTAPTGREARADRPAPPRTHGRQQTRPHHVDTGGTGVQIDTGD